MKSKLPKYAVLPAFILTETCATDDLSAVKRVIPEGHSRPELTYFVRALSERVDSYNDVPKWVKFNYNLFPIVLDKDGAPWDAATVYILSRCQEQVLPDMTTYHGIADDLSLFLRFLEEFNIDYTEFPRFKLHRPTYRFHGYLKNRIHEGKMSPTTAKRSIGSVIGFYRFLQNEKALSPSHPMWDIKDQYLTFKDARGFELNKKIEVTDIRIKAPKQTDPYDGFINDGENLRPLPQHEQRWIFEALADLQNPEMTLIHALMVLTGARIQTALTFKVRHFRKEFPIEVGEIRIPVGPGTSVDTKNDKRLTIHIPRWLYESLREYTYSARSIKRRKLTKGGDSEDQYLFLTQQGSPYYQQKIEALTFNPEYEQRHREKGQTLRVFIRDRIIPWVRKRYDINFHYRPHDLRATYGMNLTEIQLDLVEKKQKSLAQARDFVKTRMGHESSATTDLYLNFRHSQEMVYAAIDGHENYFRDLIDRAWKGASNGE